MFTSMQMFLGIFCFITVLNFAYGDDMEYNIMDSARRTKYCSNFTCNIPSGADVVITVTWTFYGAPLRKPTITVVDNLDRTAAWFGQTLTNYYLCRPSGNYVTATTDSRCTTGLPLQAKQWKFDIAKRAPTVSRAITFSLVLTAGGVAKPYNDVTVRPHRLEEDPPGEGVPATI